MEDKIANTVCPEETKHYYCLDFTKQAALVRQFLVNDRDDIVGNIRFGKILEILDKVAENCALSYVHRTYPTARVVTAAVDKIIIREYADTTQNLYFHSRINLVGKSSMEIGIRVEQLGPRPKHIASCYFTMVARSAEGDQAKSLVLPPLRYPQEVDVLRREKALLRRQAYKESLLKAEEMPSLQEYMFLKKLHNEQNDPAFAGIKAGKLILESHGRAYPEQENVPRTIFGGHLIRRAYELAAMAAEKVTPHRVVPCLVNRINFHEPVFLGDKMKYVARVIYTGKTTITVQSDIERIGENGVEKALSNSCIFTFRAVDADMDPVGVPFIYPSTYIEDERFLKGYRQRID